jgi:hypothetical protein
MVEQSRKRGPFDPRWPRYVRRHLHLVPDLEAPVVLEGDAEETAEGAPWPVAIAVALPVPRP